MDNNYVVTITDTAAREILAKQVQKNDPKLKLRVLIESGGCQGFEYKISLESEVNEEDHVYTHNEACVIIDSVSLDFLQNATVDFQDDLSARQFVIKNPNAMSSCGCGVSFST